MSPGPITASNTASRRRVIRVRRINSLPRAFHARTPPEFAVFSFIEVFEPFG
jgi:hypothetical protein